MKIITISSEEFDEYAKNHRYRNYNQTSMYGNLMSNNGFGQYYLGFLNNNDILVGASLILFKKIYGNYKYAYAPHGLLVDYNDPDFINELVKKLKELLYKQNFIFIKIDPLIHCSERNANGEVIKYNKDINQLLEIFNRAGFKHHGFNKRFENLKPRWNAILRIDDDPINLFNKFDKKVKNKLRRAKKNGVTVYKGYEEDVDVFYELIKKEHKHNLKYYKNYYNAFKGDFEIYYAKVDPNVTVIQAKDNYENELANNDRLNYLIIEYRNKGINPQKIIDKKMISDKLLSAYKERLVVTTNLLRENPNGLIIAACAIVKYDKGINLVIEGHNPKYGIFNANYLIKWAIIQKYSQEGYHYFNMNAITGGFKKDNKYKGLNEAKLRFNASAIEFVGEFDLIINEPIYRLINSSFINKKIRKKVE